MDLSIIIPFFNEEDSIHKLKEWIDQVMVREGYQYELIFIDDGSTDRSWPIVKELSDTDERIRGISFRRNYGKSAALNEGFKTANGDVVVTMDADMQDSPEEIPTLYKLIIEDEYDLISGWKKKRQDPITKTIPTRFFNYVTRLLTGIHLHDFNCGLKAYRKELVHSIEVYGEMHRYIPVIANWVGFTKIGEKVVQHHSRKFGTTKFGLERFINGFLDLLSILFVSKFGKRPMHLFGTMGTFTFIIGAIITLWVIGEKVVASIYHYEVREVVDQPLFFLALVAVVIGTQLFLTGFIAELISRNAYDRNYYHKKDSVRIE